jgi:hypothetical protein
MHATTLNSWPLFKASLSATFPQQDKEGLSAAKIRTLQQGTRSASAYVSKFRQLAADLPWSDAALMSQFRMGLNNDVKNMLVYTDRPDTLATLTDLAICCDQRITEHRNDTHRASSPPTPPHFKLNPFSDEMDLDAMSLPPKRPTPAQPKPIRPRGPLTPAERQFRIANNLCIICGSKDRPRDFCPLKRPQVNYTAINAPPFQPYPTNPPPTSDFTLCSIPALYFGKSFPIMLAVNFEPSSSDDPSTTDEET